MMVYQLLAAKYQFGPAYYFKATWQINVSVEQS